MRSEAQRESHLAAESPAAPAAPLQPPDRPRLPLKRRFSAVLGIQLAHLGRQLPGFLVLSNHAFPHRAHEENRPHFARSSLSVAQLLQGQEAVLQRGYRRAEQQSQSHHEKILWLSHLPHSGTRALSLTWQTTRARAYPRFFLTSLSFEQKVRGGRDNKVSRNNCCEQGQHDDSRHHQA